MKGDKCSQKKRALLSVSDKSGIVKLGRKLQQLGWEIISTGGTARTLGENGVAVTEAAAVTGFPEILGGRVKTLHPRIHGGLLARLELEEHRRQLAEQGILPIQLLVVNLYPFAETVAQPGVTLADAVENIDIGGPAMIRAAAKNCAHVAVVVNPDRYASIIRELSSGTPSLQRPGSSWRQKLLPIRRITMLLSQPTCQRARKPAESFSPSSSACRYRRSRNCDTEKIHSNRLLSMPWV